MVHDPLSALHQVLIFPFANNAGADADTAATHVAEKLKEKLNQAGAYQVTTFSGSLPVAQRAVSEGILKDEDIAGPFTDPGLPQKISILAGVDGFIIGSIETRTIDIHSGEVTITADATIYKIEHDPDSSVQLKSVAVTAVADPLYAGEDPTAVEQRAVAKVVSGDPVDATRPGLVQQLEPQVPAQAAEAPESNMQPIPDTTYGSHVSAPPIILAVLAVALVGVIVHNAGSHNSGGSSGGTTTTGGGNNPGGPPAPP